MSIPPVVSDPERCPFRVQKVIAGPGTSASKEHDWAALPLPADWQEWASDDPQNHPTGCACLDGYWCSLQKDAADFYEFVKVCRYCGGRKP